jgi:hypothetical protein
VGYQNRLLRFVPPRLAEEEVRSLQTHRLFARRTEKVRRDLQIDFAKLTIRCGRMGMQVFGGGMRAEVQKRTSPATLRGSSDP